MNVLSRGMRNSFRNPIRTFSIVLILGLSIGLGLTMLLARQAVDDKIAAVKSSIGNTITISPAGARGFEGGGEPLTADQLAKVTSIPTITSTAQMLNDRLTSDNTSLASAITPGSLGNRRAGNAGIGFMAKPDEARPRADGQPQFTRTFTPPVIVTGTNDLSSSSVYGSSSVTYASGHALDPTKDDNTAVVGKALAEKNNLAVGSTFTAYGQPLTVTGIYDTGNMFSNAGFVMPLAALQRLSAQPGAITSAVATVRSIDDVDSAAASVKTALGDKADVVTSQDTAKQAIAPLENVKTISTFSLIGALVAGAVIILLTMVMIVRERRREIGVMKAIGASNLKIVLQFISESVSLTLVGLLVGLAIGLLAANPITNMLVTNSTVSAATQDGSGMRLGRQGFGGALRGFGASSAANFRHIQTTVGLAILAEGFGVALIIATLGSALPALLISKVRPSEVMRAE